MLWRRLLGGTPRAHFSGNAANTQARFRIYRAVVLRLSTTHLSLRMARFTCVFEFTCGFGVGTGSSRLSRLGRPPTLSRSHLGFIEACARQKLAHQFVVFLGSLGSITARSPYRYSWRSLNAHSTEGAICVPRVPDPDEHSGTMTISWRCPHNGTRLPTILQHLVRNKSRSPFVVQSSQECRYDSGNVLRRGNGEIEGGTLACF